FSMSLFADSVVQSDTAGMLQAIKISSPDAVGRNKTCGEGFREGSSCAGKGIDAKTRMKAVADFGLRGYIVFVAVSSEIIAPHSHVSSQISDRKSVVE